MTADEREARTAEMVMKQGKDGKRQESPVGTRATSRDLFCHPGRLAPTSAAPRGEDVSEDVLGQPWEEPITAFCPITARASDACWI